MANRLVISVPAGTMEVMSVVKKAHCQKGVAELRRHLQGTNYIGLDAEWNSDGNSSPVALLQLATVDGFCLLIKLHKMHANTIPSELTDLLRDANILKVGVQIDEDARRLQMLPGGKGPLLQVHGCRDLKSLVSTTVLLQKYAGKQIPSLADLADHAGVPFQKATIQTRSDWEADQLTADQVKYAAQDAFIGAKIYSKLR